MPVAGSGSKKGTKGMAPSSHGVTLEILSAQMRTQHEALMGRLGALEEEFRTVAAKTDKATTDVAVLSSRLGGMEQRVTNSEAQLQHVPRNGDLTALDSQVRALQAAMHLSDKASAMQWGKITGIVIGVSTAVSVIISILGLAWKK